MGRPRASIATRLAVNSIPEPNSGCHLWTGYINHAGYGFLGGIPFGTRLAHRLAYQLAHGPVPDGLTLDHLCRVRCCINPDHLEPVTRGENVRRGEAGRATGARQRAKTHCPKGHPYSGANLKVSRHGNRSCRACCAASARRKNGSNP